MRRLGIALLAALLALSSVQVLAATPAAAAERHGAGDAPSGTEGDGSDVRITRYGGSDRYETSLRIAEAVAEEAGGSLEWVVLVSGERWTDAVVAAPVAGALGAPVLMTPPGELRDDAREFLQRVGISKALVIGPEEAGSDHGPGRGVGADVMAALDDARVSAERIAGDDRYSTGVAAARRVTPGAMGDEGGTAMVASGEVFADALVAGPFAARGHHPVLLTPPGELHADASGYLAEAGLDHVVLMGGTAALSGEVEQSIKDLGINVTRVAGATRYDTAVKAAELVTDRYTDTAGEPCFATSTIGLARARVPFDSFSAAPLLARLCAPLMLADPQQIPPDTAAYLDAAREAHDTVDLRVFGGDAAVSRSAIDAYLTGDPVDLVARQYVVDMMSLGVRVDPRCQTDCDYAFYPGDGRRDLGSIKAVTGIDLVMTNPGQGDYLERFEDRTANARVVHTYADIEAARAHGDLAVMWYLQRRSPTGRWQLDGDAATLREWYDDGLRVLQISYGANRPDATTPAERLGYGSSEGDEDGVTDLGRRAIAEMNSLGMIIDCSHCNKQTTLDAATLSTQPILANHANAEMLTPAGRNKSDEELIAIAATGGVIGVTPIRAYLDTDSDGAAGMDDMIAHIEYIVSLVGIDHVGLASDSYVDGWAQSSPYFASADLAALDRWVRLTARLRERGWSDEDIAKLLGGNFLRVFRQVLQPQ